MIRRLQNNDRGATAIEYAVIAGLIGLGIVGSLVTTRGSLSTVFGKTSSGLASTDASSASGNGPGATPTSTRTAFWQSKTLAAPRNGTATNATYTFTDGVKVSFSLASSGDYIGTLTIFDPNTATRTLATYDANGAMTAYYLTKYDQYGRNSTVEASDVVYGDTFSENAPSASRLSTYSYPNNSPTAQQNGITTSSPYGSSAQTRAASQTAYQDLIYFRDAMK